MGRPWTDHPSWELVDEATDIAGRDVGALLLHADADELRDTRNAQLTTFVSSLMVLDAVESLGIEPSYCAGHSLGEYTALTATGALSFDEGVRLVVERAEAMYQAGNDHPGTMAAVLGLDDDLVGGLDDHREPGLGDLGQLEGVETDERDVLGDPQPGLVDGDEGADGELVVQAHDGGGSLGLGEQAAQHLAAAAETHRRLDAPLMLARAEVVVT